MAFITFADHSHLRRMASLNDRKSACESSIRSWQNVDDVDTKRTGGVFLMDELCAQVRLASHIGIHN